MMYNHTLWGLFVAEQGCGLCSKVMIENRGTNQQIPTIFGLAGSVHLNQPGCFLSHRTVDCIDTEHKLNRLSCERSPSCQGNANGDI